MFQRASTAAREEEAMNIGMPSRMRILCDARIATFSAWYTYILTFHTYIHKSCNQNYDRYRYTDTDTNTYKAAVDK